MNRLLKESLYTLTMSEQSRLCHAPENNPRLLIYRELNTFHSSICSEKKMLSAIAEASQETLLMNGPVHPSTLHTQYNN